MKFLLTRELGRLAKWLRILGFDARYEASGNKSFIMIEALKEKRVLLTRNLRFGSRHGGTVVFIKGDKLEEQLKSLFKQLFLKIEPSRLFSRCTVCNEPLGGIKKAEVKKHVPEYVYQTHDAFMRCPKCARVYWKGTHWGNVEGLLKGLDDGICCRFSYTL